MASERSIPRRLWDLALPVIGLNVLNVLALVVDTAMCGRLDASEAALTGLGFASQLVFLLMVAMMGLSVGSVAIVSRAHGAGEHDRVEHIMRQSTQLTVVLALVVAVFGNAIAEPLLLVLGAEGEALTEGLRYLRPLLTGTVFYYLVLLYAALLRGVGNTRLPFLVALASNIINVVLNYGLILGNFGLPQLGVQGAALGTVASHVFASATLIALLKRGAVPGVRIALTPRRIDIGLVSDLLRVGAPAAMDLVVLQSSFLSIIGMLGHLDQVAVAAHGVGIRIQALAFVPGLAISQATAAMVGQALGARDVERARAVTRASMVLATGVMTILAATIIAGAAPIIDVVFDIEPASAIGGYAITWIRILGAGMPIVGVHIALIGMLRGSGATLTGLRANVVATAIQIPLSAALGYGAEWGAFGIWVAFPVAFVIKTGLELVAYRRGRWAKVGSRA